MLLMTDNAVDGFINCVPYLDGAREEGFLVCKCASRRQDVVLCVSASRRRGVSDSWDIGRSLLVGV